MELIKGIAFNVNIDCHGYPSQGRMREENYTIQCHVFVYSVGQQVGSNSCSMNTPVSFPQTYTCTQKSVLQPQQSSLDPLSTNGEDACLAGYVLHL